MPSTTNFGWTTPADTDLVKDGASAIRTLGNGIDTSFVDLKGGTTGQVLSKNSNTDLDFTWVTQNDSDAIQNTIVDAKGDLISATAADTPARLAVGADGTVLTADSTTATGLKWSVVVSGATHNYEAITSSTTWTVPASAKYVDVLIVGGGQGGRGGYRVTSNSMNPGNGGGVVYMRDIFLNGTGTVAVTIGAGSNGTAGNATTGIPAAASAGGFTAFGTYGYAQGGGNAGAPGLPGYKGTICSNADSFTFAQDGTYANFAPLMNPNADNGRSPMNGGVIASQSFSGLNVTGFVGGWGGSYATTSGNLFIAGTHPGMGQADAGAVTAVTLTNTLPTPGIPSSFLAAIGDASAGTSGTGGGAGGAAGQKGIAGGGGSCHYTAGQPGAQGGAGAGGGGSRPNPVGGTGGNGGNAGTNSGAGGGAGANSGSTTGGTGGNGGNGAAGIVVVRWIS